MKFLTNCGILSYAQKRMVGKMSKKLIFNNTHKSGRMTFFAFKEKDSFIGVCLEFDLVVKADSLKEAIEHIEDLASGWLENVMKNNLPEELLNKPAPNEYWEKYKKYLADSQRRAELKKQLLIPNKDLEFWALTQPYSPHFKPFP